MMRTTGVLLFDSGYTTNVSTERPSCLTLTHSRWRGDFSSLALAQSCAETACAASKRRINPMYFMLRCLQSPRPGIYHRERSACAKWKKLVSVSLIRSFTETRPPHPRCFAKRVPKRLKTKEGRRQKSAKSEKESAST